jgi:hypothetical protein
MRSRARPSLRKTFLQLKPLWQKSCPARMCTSRDMIESYRIILMDAERIQRL